MKRALLMLLLSQFSCRAAFCQTDWIAPEGKIINYRTLDWSDFLDKPDKDEDPRAGAAVRPVIYFIADSAEELPNDRLSYKFHVKCAFQSAAWVKEAVEKEHTYYYLNHEQDHYDIALNYANILQATLSGRDYSIKNYNDEIDKIYLAMYEKFMKTEEDYDNEGNHSLVKDKQELWDMRIKKCFENNTDEYYYSPEKVVQTVKYYGQSVKRIPHEPARQFATRCRPIYSEFPEELAAKTFETKEWTIEKAVIAFYTQRYTVQTEDAAPKDCTRILAYAFMPLPKNEYKRVLIDTFTSGDKPVKIAAVFFANADSDKTHELIVMTTSTRHDKEASGTLYTNQAYDFVYNGSYPGKLRRMEEVNRQIEGGFDGTINGKASKAKFKTEKDVADVLKKMGY